MVFLDALCPADCHLRQLSHADGFSPDPAQSHPAYQPENALVRAMVEDFVPPAWAKQIIVTGDAAYGSQENMKMVLRRDAHDPVRRWGFVFAIARMWKTAEGKAIKNLVTHLSRICYQRTRVPRLPASTGCKTFWVYSTRLCLRHIGAVTMVLSKTGRNVGPKHTKILVTNLDEWTPRQVVCAYQRRWPVEQINRKLKTALGLGEHQVSRKDGRIEKSFGIAVLAYLLLLRTCHQKTVLGKAWSIDQIQHTFRLRVMTNQVEHNLKVRLTKRVRWPKVVLYAHEVSILMTIVIQSAVFEWQTMSSTDGRWLSILKASDVRIDITVSSLLKGLARHAGVST